MRSHIDLGGGVLAIGTEIEHRKGAWTEISESTGVKRVTGRVAVGADEEPHRLRECRGGRAEREPGTRGHRSWTAWLRLV